jgi:hypothetical protein
MSIFKNVYKLPNDIIKLIKKYLPYKTLVFINNFYYNQYHYIIRKFIPHYENFTRNIIKRDNEFVFKQVIEENFDHWIKNKQYMYKNMIFNNYIYFVIYLCIENNSIQCREVIYDYLKKRDLCINLHKKNIVKYIKWKN